MTVKAAVIKTGSPPAKRRIDTDIGVGAVVVGIGIGIGAGAIGAVVAIAIAQVWTTVASAAVVVLRNGIEGLLAVGGVNGDGVDEAERQLVLRIKDCGTTAREQNRSDAGDCASSRADGRAAPPIGGQPMIAPSAVVPPMVAASAP